MDPFGASFGPTTTSGSRRNQTSAPTCETFQKKIVALCRTCYKKSTGTFTRLPSASVLQHRPFQKLAMRPRSWRASCRQPGQSEWHHPLWRGPQRFPACLPSRPCRRKILSRPEDNVDCTTTVSRSFSATNFRGEPTDITVHGVRSTILTQDEGGHGEKGWSGPSRRFLSSVKCFSITRCRAYRAQYRGMPGVVGRPNHTGGENGAVGSSTRKWIAGSFPG